MIFEIALLLVMFFIAALGLLVFAFKNMLYVILSLLFIFLLTAFIFLMLGQPLLAVLQVIITVGGISTYMFVAVAAVEFSNFKFVSFAKVVALSAVIFAVIVYPMKAMVFSDSGTPTNLLTQQLIAKTMSSQIFNIFIIAIVLFGATISSIILLRELGRK